MACSRELVLLLIFTYAASIHGSDVDQDLEPNAHRVPEKVEHNEKASVQYKVNTIKLTGNKHAKMDDKRPPPWPPRPGRRSAIPMKAMKARNDIPTVIRPGRSLEESFSIYRAKRRHLQGPSILRPGREDVPQAPPSLFRPGREDMPKAGPPILFRPGREDMPKAGPPILFRPGREDVPEGPPILFRPGREDVPKAGPPILFRPGREDVPHDVETEIVQSSRNEIPEPQFKVVRPGRRSIGYNMPWTYVGSSVHSNLQHKSETYKQKALEEKTKRNSKAAKMNEPSEQQDF